VQSFEFIMVLLSIVIGLGVAEVLGVVARVLRRELQVGLVHALWATYVLLLLLQLFWSSWTFEARPDWSFPELLVFLLPGLFIFVVAAMLNPPPGTTGSLDDYFLEVHRRLFGGLVATAIAASLAYTVLADGPGATDVVRGLIVLLYLGMAVSHRRSTHIIGAFMMLFALTAFAFAWTFSLSGM
jgi:hypothetical protein